MSIFNANKNTNTRLRNVLTWLVPLLLIQSIAIIALIYYLIGKDEKTKPEEFEVDVRTETNTVSKTKRKSSQENIPSQVNTENKDIQNNDDFSLSESESEDAGVVNSKDIIGKEASQTQTNSQPNVVNRRELNRNRLRALPIVDQQLGRAEVAKNEPVVLGKEKPKEQKIIANQKMVAPIKKAKVEEQKNQINLLASKPVSTQKTVHIEGTTPAPVAEVAPVYFEIPEIKDETGAYAQRTEEGRSEAVFTGGGSVTTEGGVETALWWLANHQEIDGHWDSGKYEGTANLEFDLAVTGSAIMAFISAGKTDTVGDFKLNVQSALKWLVKMQKKDGSWDRRNYANAICTMAVTEAASMGAGGEEVKKCAVLGMEYILKQQNISGCFDYTGNTKRDDMSVTGWCISALKSGAIAGIKLKEIGEAYEILRDTFDNVDGLKDISPTSKGLAWYTPTTVGSGGKGSACQAIAMFVSQQIGRENTEPTPWLIAAADGQIATIPKTYEKTNLYRTYYGYLALRAVGGKHWLAWNEPVSKILIEAQRLDGDFRGSWDKNGSSIDKAGRVMYTAFCCLCLEIYYRYPTVF